MPFSIYLAVGLFISVHQDSEICWWILINWTQVIHTRSVFSTCSSKNVKCKIVCTFVFKFFNFASQSGLWFQEYRLSSSIWFGCHSIISATWWEPRKRLQENVCWHLAHTLRFTHFWFTDPDLNFKFLFFNQLLCNLFHESCEFCSQIVNEYEMRMDTYLFPLIIYITFDQCIIKRK